ncbi:UDP-glucose dehydrogenase family protein [Mesorhizobium xinjiangense]|uniref:UDP-glucose dehydrogenase family protein n=1 Tax=Mesorhizobium xinjiangense TaxID=2678685 RepID=UPI0012EEACBD|nr:UDP-glucose/GDP-mannose dehydrogenase family protein [Mesorhizobium xinjiangense]
MKIVVIGTGYVGLVSGTCLSGFGYDVTCVDRDASKIERLNRGECPIYEPQLEPMIRAHSASGHLHFTTDPAGVVPWADAVVLAVGTPVTKDTGEIDLSQIFASVEEIAPLLSDGVVVITKSTVMVGTNARIRNRIAQLRPNLRFSVVSNPEFLREGSAVQDFLKADRIVIGAHDDHGRAVTEQLYRPLQMQDTIVKVTSLEDAEISKYACNAFLAAKVTFINEIADLCERTGGNVMEVADIMGMDPRIGDLFLRAGPGFGGSCFPKDTRALATFGDAVGAPQGLVKATIATNEARKRSMAQRVLKAIGQPTGKQVALFGVAFKPETDDLRESPALTVVEHLLEAGVGIRGFDPQAADAAGALFPQTHWFDDPYDAASGADAVVIMTEWNVLRALDLMKLKSAMRTPVMIDLRNIHRRKEPARYGFTYISVGRDVAEPTHAEQSAGLRRKA